MDGPIRRFKAVPIEFGVEAQSVGRDLLFGQLARLPQPAVRVGIKTTPIKERVEVDRLAANEDGVLLKAALQLGIRLDGNGLGHGGQGARWGADRIGSQPGRPGFTPTRSCRGACW